MQIEEIDAILGKVIEGNSNIVNNWLAGGAGSWGALAGKAIVAVQRHFDRSLTETEKHIVWQLMWNKLMKIKESI